MHNSETPIRIHSSALFRLGRQKQAEAINRRSEGVGEWQQAGSKTREKGKRTRQKAKSKKQTGGQRQADKNRQKQVSKPR